MHFCNEFRSWLLTPGPAIPSYPTPHHRQQQPHQIRHPLDHDAMVWQVILRVRPIPAGQDSCLALVEGTSKVQTTTPPNSVNFKILGEQVGRLAGIGCVLMDRCW